MCPNIFIWETDYVDLKSSRVSNYADLWKAKGAPLASYIDSSHTRLINAS